jgi:hypothetical protein
LEERMSKERDECCVLSFGEQVVNDGVCGFRRLSVDAGGIVGPVNRKEANRCHNGTNGTKRRGK